MICAWSDVAKALRLYFVDYSAIGFRLQQHRMKTGIVAQSRGDPYPIEGVLVFECSQYRVATINQIGLFCLSRRLVGVAKVAIAPFRVAFTSTKVTTPFVRTFVAVKATLTPLVTIAPFKTALTVAKATTFRTFG